MNKLKGKLSLLLVAIMMMATFMPIFAVYAADCEVSMTVKMGNTTLNTTNTYTVEGGEKLTVKATSNAGIAFIGYRYVKNGTYGDITDINSDTITITIPNGEAGSTLGVRIEAVANNDDGSANTVTKTGWIQYNFKYKSASVKTVTASMNGKALSQTSANSAAIKSNIDLKATPAEEVTRILYSWDDEATYQAAGATKTIIVPERFEEGTTHTLYVTAQYADGTIPDWSRYKITIPVTEVPEQPEEPEEVYPISMTVKLGNTTMSAGKTYTVEAGDKIVAKATSQAGVAFIGYRYVENGVAGQITDVNSDTLTITVPAGTPGSSIKLRIEAVGNNDDGTPNTVTKTGWREYTLVYKEEAVVEPPVEEPEETEITVALKLDGKTVSTSAYIYVYLDDVFSAVATCNIDVEKIVYAWDDEDSETIKASKGTIEIPEDFEIGSEHTLTLQAVAEDGTKSAKKEYTIIIDEEVEEDDDELIVEPWMEENDDLEELAVSLRNDSEEDKANKNIYELNEEVIYYVDYKNGGKDLKKSATLVLNIPETFKVVSSDGGSVSTSKGTITWKLGALEEDEAGTKTVVLKYTKIGSSKVTYKIVKPLAEIKVDSKVKDNSAVINMIYKDKDTEIKDLHLPYMFGDKEKPTFRPDDTITRAEGALVLTRIFGISTAYDNSAYNYPDLDETYLEARKAIIAATEYGIINGYEDGTYKPNKAMTRAEFMKIIANRVAIENEDGFEIKDLESSIKVYDDPTRVYVVNSDYITEHWALEEVSLLARLNMTPLTESKTNLRLDEPITRAEVAQLVNFYLLRAPADVTSKTKTDFSDVNKSHKLFADIVEATREAHTYFITDETTEEAEF